MSLPAAQALESKLVSLANSSTFQREKNILQFHKHRQICDRSTCRSHLLRHQKIDEVICRLLCCRSGGIEVLDLVIRQPARTSTCSRGFVNLQVSGRPIPDLASTAFAKSSKLPDQPGKQIPSDHKASLLLTEFHV